MRLSKLIVPILAIGNFTAGAATTCSNGIPGIQAGGVCCVKECGECGGSGCATRRGTDGKVRDCCTSAIKDSKKLCSTEKEAPCIVDSSNISPPSVPSGTTTTCSNGIPGIEAGGVCCVKECGECGGSGCSSRKGADGKVRNCCTSVVKESKRLCSKEKEAPCIVDNPGPKPTPPRPSPPAPSPTPKPPSGGSFVCSKNGGILNNKGDVCCKAECGECGGSGCGQRAGLTGDDCCVGKIMKTGPKCSVYGKAPCFVDQPMSPSPTPPKPPSPAPGTGGPFTCEGNQGILKKDICCSPGCGECGGKNCAKRGPGLTGDDCCTSAIMGSNRLCSKTGQAPCIFDGVAPGPSPPGPPSGLTSLGCYKDDKSDRLFKYRIKVDSKMTPQLCAEECKGKALFGTQYGTECWCSDSKSGYDKYGEGRCDIPCGGDSNQTCGGRFAMEVYEVPASSPAPAPGPTPKPPSGGAFVCDGILDNKGEVCCKAACGECGGKGCGNRPGLTGRDCCIGNIKDGPKCSAQGKAPCVLDGAAVAPGPTPTPGNALGGSCGSTKAQIKFRSDLIELSGGGCATLTDIYNAQKENGNGHLNVLSSADSKTGWTSAEPTGNWLLTSDLKVVGGSTLFVQGTSRNGDCNVLRIQSTGSKAWEIMGHGGNLKFEGTTVTSWDTSNKDHPSKGKEQTNYKNKRAFLRCITEYDDSDKYNCKGRSKKDMGTCRMDLIDSTFGNMGYKASESYGLTWKVRGLCTPKLENVSLFNKRNVYGDIKGCDIYGMYYGMYSYGHQDGVWIHNKMHDNIQYGFDPHDDSDNLTIAHNEVYRNKNHGIIASKRCNDVKIYNNTVYDNDQCGIMLHRSSDDAEVYDNKLTGNLNAGIAFFESMDGQIYNNTISGCDKCKFGIRLSLGSENNVIENNTLDNFSRYGLYTYKGSDKPEASDGRPKNNKFINNYVSNVKVGVQVKDSRNIVFDGNKFENVETYEFPKSTGIVWKSNNEIGDGCMKDKPDFASGSIPRCS